MCSTKLLPYFSHFTYPTLFNSLPNQWILFLYSCYCYSFFSSVCIYPILLQFASFSMKRIEEPDRHSFCVYYRLLMLQKRSRTKTESTNSVCKNTFYSLPNKLIIAQLIIWHKNCIKIEIFVEIPWNLYTCKVFYPV